MPYIRMTLVKLLDGKAKEITSLLEKLDEVISPTPGMLFSAVIYDKDVPTENRRIGRISVRQSMAQAQSEATSDRILAIRARIHTLSQEVVTESLFEVGTGWFPMDINPGKMHIGQPASDIKPRLAATA